MHSLDSVQLFNLAPLPMVLEDLSGLKQLFDEWQTAGIEDICAYLQADPMRMQACLQHIKILQVNQKALALFAADSEQQLSQHLDQIFQDDMLISLLQQYILLWQKQAPISTEMMCLSLDGKRLELLLHILILPGHEYDLGRVFITAEDLSPHREAQKIEKRHRQFAEGMFKFSPASLWVEDFSRIKTRLDHLRNLGIEDFRTFLDVHPEFIEQCMSDIILIDVNQATIDLFAASSKEELIQNLDRVFCGEMRLTFREQLIELWNGNIHHRREAVNYALDGSIRNVLLQFSVFPGYEEDWAMVQVSLTDITARKKAEAYLEYLGKHDVLTKLFNRSFYTEEIHRLNRSIIRPISCIYLDMNGLKMINDRLGHDIGDGLLRRVGDILNQAVNAPHTVSRIGGDEFVVLMLGANEQEVETTVQTINELFHIDNQYYSSLPIHMAIGYATSQENENIENMIKRADHRMYEDKQRYYQEKEFLEQKKDREI
ncbi:sensor domain-containing diguanylate cyclase [Acinetobacter populi]|uniref:Histidine kinase n=1 Tax=Acinetobacter populi TaxID=1582270 RepID=A0A1Z9YTH4_9GAMM|nr:sensor domain-containing diguanylate cyclase [Acinetobacter populi]OUY05526.1 histidine kinase [Acinetobacter populi]